MITQYLFVVVSKSVAKLQARHQDLLQQIKDGGKLAGLHNSKVIYFLPNA